MAMRQLLDGLRYFARGRKCRGMVLPFGVPRAVRRQTPLMLSLFARNPESVNKNSEQISIFEKDPGQPTSFRPFSAMDTWVAPNSEGIALSWHVAAFQADGRHKLCGLKGQNNPVQGQRPGLRVINEREP
jgi:hypothetical protein